MSMQTSDGGNARTIDVREAREAYFETAGFDESGYDDRWVTLKAGPVPVLKFPNSAARVRAVRLHDLHHVATGYDTSWTGEAEIGAWEIAGGCGNHLPAWILNLGAMAVGLLIAPVATFRAFVRGRASTPLYIDPVDFEPGLLDMSLEDLRTKLGLTGTGPREATAGDALAFAGWSALALVANAWPIAAFIDWVL